jgi:integrase
MGRARKEVRLRLRGGVWYATVYVGGARIERSTGERDEAEATRVAQRWGEESKAPSRNAASTTLNEALGELLDDRRARVRDGTCSDDTADFYEGKAAMLLAFFGHDFALSPWERDSRASWDYIRWRRTSEVSDRTIRKELGTLATALGLAKEQGRFAGDPRLAVPTSFAPAYEPSLRSPTRAEFLRLVPQLRPDAAAQVAFILATSAEMSAVERALKVDIPRLVRPPMVVPVRGSKTDDRNRPVPIVTDEQIVLIRFVARHADGSGDRLFGRTPNRLIADACKRVDIEHASPHDFRHAAGQWLLDVGVSIELVSRILGHSSTSVTERIYARVKQDAVGDRILDVIDPSYAKGASRARRRKARRIETITSIPEPKQVTTYRVGAETLSLDAWAKKSGIAKGTLYWRVVLRGLPMRDALARGPGPGRPAAKSPLADRSTAAILPRNPGTDRPLLALAKAGDPPDPEDISVGHDGLEPSANGLRVRCSTN